MYSKALIIFGAAFSFSSIASDNTVSVLQIEPYYKGTPCENEHSYHFSVSSGDQRHIGSTQPYGKTENIKLSTLDESITTYFGNAVEKYIHQSDYNHQLTNFQITTTEVIPFVFHSPVKTESIQKDGKDNLIYKVSYKGLVNEVIDSGYVRSYQKWLDADIIWITTKCLNADNTDELGFADRQSSITEKRPSRPPTIITRHDNSNEMKAVAAHEFGHTMTLKHDLDTQHYYDKTTLDLNDGGVGLLVDQGNNDYVRTLMSYCPKSGKCGINQKQPFSNGSVKGLYDEHVVKNYQNTLDCKSTGNKEVKAKACNKLNDFSPNSMAVIYDVLPKMMEWSNISQSDSGSKTVFRLGNSIRSSKLSDYFKTGAQSTAVIGTPYNDNYTGIKKGEDVYVTAGFDKINPGLKQNSKIKIIVDPEYFISDKKYSPVNYTLVEFAKSTEINNRTNKGYCFYLRKGTHEHYKELSEKYNKLSDKSKEKVSGQKLLAKINLYQQGLFSNLCSGPENESNSQDIMEVFFLGLPLVIGLEERYVSNDIDFYNDMMTILQEKPIE